MPVHAKVGDTQKPARNIYVNIGEVWTPAKKVYTKVAGTWREGWPRRPNAPTNVKLTQSYNATNQNIEIDVTWAAPSGGEPVTKYEVSIKFTDPVSGAVLQSAWTDKGMLLTHAYDNAGNGWQHRAGNKVVATVKALANTNIPESQWGEWGEATASTAEQTVMNLPIPAVATSLSLDVNACKLTQTWAHPGGANLDHFEIQTWLGDGAATTYKPAASARSWNQYPWDANTIGRYTVHSRIRAVGDSGASAWSATVSGVMPGPIAISNSRFSAGSLYVTIDNNWDGVDVYRQTYGGATVYQAHQGATGGTAINVQDNASAGYAVDNSTHYRMVFVPEGANGWTGRTQVSPWAIKIPNPVVFEPSYANTWWSIPIPGKWRTNPQADNWMYQGKSISGNSVGTLWYGSAFSSYFAPWRIGYDPGCTQVEIHIKRTNTGGLVAAVPISIYGHTIDDDSVNAMPNKILGPFIGASYKRDQQAWQAIPTSWYDSIQAGTMKGISFYVEFNHPQNYLRSEIGMVSNMYMIIDKPAYGRHLDGRPPGTLRIYHNG